MYFLKVNGTELPTPSYYAVDADDIDSADSRRSDETGKMHRRCLRAGVKTCSVRWILGGQQARSLLKSLSDPLLTVSMLNPADAGYCECEMFASELKSVFYQQKGGAAGSYWEISCRLTEY